MGELGGDDALDRRVITTERQEEVDDTFAYSNLFTLFVDILIRREEEEYLCIGVVFVLWFSHRGFQSRVYEEDTTNFHLF
jgi:hypothetical protein